MKWQKVKIKDLFSFSKGILQSSKNTEGAFHFITASSDWKTHIEYSHDQEALVFASAASGSLGRTHYVNGKFISSDLCFVLSPKDSINYPLNLKFYHTVFNSLRKDIVKNTKAGTSKEAIALGRFGNYELPYVDLAIQNKTSILYGNIVYNQSKLSTELINQRSLIKKLKQAYLTEAIQGKLVEQDPTDEPAIDLLAKIKAEKDLKIKNGELKKPKSLKPITPEEIPFDIPENWTWCKLGEVCDLISGNNYASEDFVKTGGIKCIKITNAGVNEFVETSDYLPKSFKTLYQKYLVYENDLILALTRPYISNGLKISICPNSYNNSLLNQRVLSIRSTKVNFKYVYTFLSSKYILNIYKGKFQGIGQQPNLKIEDVSNLLLPLPPLAEQIRIVARLNELMATCDKLESENQKSIQNSKELLQVVLKEMLDSTDL